MLQRVMAAECGYRLLVHVAIVDRGSEHTSINTSHHPLNEFTHVATNLNQASCLWYSTIHQVIIRVSMLGDRHPG